MYKVKVFVTYKKSILDPQGTAVQKTINNIFEKSVNNLRIDKYITFDISDDTEDIEDIDNTIDKICDEILANPNMEEYRYEFEKVED